jgi:hypothetical protein
VVSASPLVSVVIATHNRSQALRATLASLRGQTFEAWDAIVVGDRCTDDTADAIASLGDHRVRFVDLARNFGEQAGPNNIGIARTRAPFVAFLNHDDLWYPDHLQVLTEAIIGTGADLVFAASLNVVGSGDPRDADTFVVSLESVGVDGSYDLAERECVVPASTWLVRRPLLDDLRGWRTARDVRIEPSQDLLVRAARRGAVIRAIPAVTVVTFPSGVREGAYLTDDVTEQQTLLARLDDDDLRMRLVAQDPRTTAAGAQRARGAESRGSRAWRRTIRVVSRVGPSARELDFRLRRRVARGGYVSALRARRGLDDHRTGAGARERVRYAEARRHGAYRLGDRHSCSLGGGGVRFLASGWSAPEAWGTWSDGTHAQIVLELAARPDGPLTVELDVRGRLAQASARQRVRATVRGTEVAALDLTTDRPAARWSFTVPAERSRRRTFVLDLELPDAAAPGTHDGADRRLLAVGIEALRVTCP